MTEEQKELLKAMHTIQEYCHSTECAECALKDNNHCCFIAVDECIPEKWKLKPLEEEESWSVFR